MKKINENKNSKKFNYTINKVNDEIVCAKKYVENLNATWKENYSDVYCYDLQYLSNDDIKSLEIKYDGLYDLSKYKDDSKRIGQAIHRAKLENYCGDEYICEFRKLDWIISNNKIVRIFNFINTGEIMYSQIKKKRKDSDQSYDYYAVYDVNNNDIFLRFENFSEDFSFINTSFREYHFGNKSIVEDDKIIKITEILDEDKILELEVNRFGKVVKRTVVLENSYYVIEGNDIISAFVNDNEVVLDDEMISILNMLLLQFELNKIKEDSLFDYINCIKNKVIYAIKSIKGDVPMDVLSKRLDVALSTINTKKAVEVEEQKELKKIK